MAIKNCDAWVRLNGFIILMILGITMPYKAAICQSRTSNDIVADSIPGTLVRFEMVRIPQGMVKNESGLTTVASFYIGRTEVSWDMYDVYMYKLDSSIRNESSDAISRPSMPYSVPDYDWGHAGYAAMSIAYHAAEEFAKWLSAVTGNKYRLPTDAEWQHAANLAWDSSFDTNIDSIAWHKGNSSGKTHAIASRNPDALGLFDMFGNVLEWVSTNDVIPIARGGSFRDDAKSVGPSFRVSQKASWTERDPQLPSSRWWLTDGPFVGFRLVREP